MTSSEAMTSLYIQYIPLDFCMGRVRLNSKRFMLALRRKSHLDMNSSGSEKNVS